MNGPRTPTTTDIITALTRELDGKVCPGCLETVRACMAAHLLNSLGDDETLDDIVRRHLLAGRIPGQTIEWIPFYQLIWRNLGHRASHRGFSESSIQRSVKRVKCELGMGE